MAESFANRFEAAWLDPSPEGLASLLVDDVVLYQPHLPPIRGKEAVLAEFRHLFRCFPGAYSRTTHAQENETEAFIEHVLHVPLGEDFVRIPSVDRFVLRDGLGAERTVYFDQVRLLTEVARHPSLWLAFAKYRFGR